MTVRVFDYGTPAPPFVNLLILPTRVRFQTPLFNYLYTQQFRGKRIRSFYGPPMASALRYVIPTDIGTTIVCPAGWDKIAVSLSSVDQPNPMWPQTPFVPVHS
jgi:hypothetical protein